MEAQRKHRCQRHTELLWADNLTAVVHLTRLWLHTELLQCRPWVHTEVVVTLCGSYLWPRRPPGLAAMSTQPQSFEEGATQNSHSILLAPPFLLCFLLIKNKTHTKQTKQQNKENNPTVTHTDVFLAQEATKGLYGDFRFQSGRATLIQRRQKIPQISISDALSTPSPFSLCLSAVLSEMHISCCTCWFGGFVWLFPGQSKLNCLEPPS